MRNVCVLLMLILISSPLLLADTQDTAVFKTALRTDAEVPAVLLPGTSGAAAITVHVTRDARGNVDSASVTFEIDYTVTAATTFTGLHIHNAAAGSNGSVAIDTGIAAAAPVTVAVAGSGRITRVVNYTSTDAAGIRFVTGLLAQPELYYVNIHSATNTSGLMRGQLLRTFRRFRPSLSPAFEVPGTNVDGEGAALVEVQVNRDANGVITSGVVTFDVDYRFPTPVTLSGLHIHNAPFGVNGGVVIDSGLNDTTRAITNATRGNIFRIAEIDSTNANGITALNGLMADPTQYYINMHTTVNPGGAIRGQLSTDVYAFFNQMTAAEEVPPTTSTGSANSMTYIRLDRDSTGNVVSGATSFNVNFNMGGGPVTFTGLHIHNAKFGVNGGVVIDSRISGGSPVIDDDGVGSINREVAIDATSTAAAQESLRAVIENPGDFYVNLHTTTNAAGIIRAQLVRETYHFRTAMSTANEAPPVVSDASGTGWVTVRVARDANNVINGGTVIFDVNHVGSAQTTFTGLHIHHPGAAGVNAGVTINTGISGTNPVDSPTGTGNITRTVNIASTETNGIATLNTLINSPDLAYINLHTTVNTSGLMRSQMLPVQTTVAQTAGGGEWLSSITVKNPSATASVHGIVNLLQSDGTAVPATLSDPNRTFLIPPGGSATFNMNNKGTLTTGFAKIFTNSPVTVDVGYQHPVYTTSGRATTTTARAVSIPVTVAASPALRNTGIALVAQTAGNLVLTLTDSGGVAIAGGSRTIDVTARQHILGFVRDLLPTVTSTSFAGTLTITANATAGTGALSVTALQFNGSLAPVTITILP